MTEDIEKPITHEESVDGAPSLPNQPTVDFFLQTFVSLANNTGTEIGVTLCVGGIVVSGLLISGKKYFDGIANEFLQAPGPADQAEFRKVLGESMANVGKMIYGPGDTEEPSGDKDDEAEKPLLAFIHLRDAKFFHNSGPPFPSNRGVWWRGRLSAVDGFSLGSMTAN